VIFENIHHLYIVNDFIFEIFEDGRQKLIINNAKVEDQGNYRCEATNVAGSMSSKAPLSVRGDFSFKYKGKVETLIPLL